MKFVIFMVWASFWWGLTCAALFLGGKFVNFFMPLIVISCPACLAGFLYLWPMGPWREEGWRGLD